MFFSPILAWQRIATHNSRTPDLTLIEQWQALWQALHAGGVLFCGHSNHTVEPINRIRPDRAVQALLPGLSWRGNFCQPAVEPHFSSKMHAPPDCPKSAESTVTTNTAACGTQEWQKKQEFPGPSQREQREKLEGRAAHHAEDKLTPLQLLSGTSQTHVTSQPGTGCHWHHPLNCMGKIISSSILPLYLVSSVLISYSFS